MLSMLWKYHYKQPNMIVEIGMWLIYFMSHFQLYHNNVIESKILKMDFTKVAKNQ